MGNCQEDQESMREPMNETIISDFFNVRNSRDKKKISKCINDHFSEDYDGESIDIQGVSTKWSKSSVLGHWMNMTTDQSFLGLTDLVIVKLKPNLLGYTFKSSYGTNRYHMIAIMSFSSKHKILRATVEIQRVESIKVDPETKGCDTYYDLTQSLMDKESFTTTKQHYYDNNHLFKNMSFSTVEYGGFVGAGNFGVVYSIKESANNIDIHNWMGLTMRNHVNNSPTNGVNVKEYCVKVNKDGSVDQALISMHRKISEELMQIIRENDYDITRGFNGSHEFKIFINSIRLFENFVMMPRLVKFTFEPHHVKSLITSLLTLRDLGYQHMDIHENNIMAVCLESGRIKSIIPIDFGLTLLIGDTPKTINKMISTLNLEVTGKCCRNCDVKGLVKLIRKYQPISLNDDRLEQCEISLEDVDKLI